MGLNLINGLEVLTADILNVKTVNFPRLVIKPTEPYSINFTNLVENKNNKGAFYDYQGGTWEVMSNTAWAHDTPLTDGRIYIPEPGLYIAGLTIAFNSPGSSVNHWDWFSWSANIDERDNLDVSLGNTCQDRVTFIGDGTDTFTDGHNPGDGPVPSPSMFFESQGDSFLRWGGLLRLSSSDESQLNNGLTLSTSCRFKVVKIG